jgi:hypothetical protein
MEKWTKDQDRQRRNNWLRRMTARKAGSSVLVGDYGETLADVVRWLEEAINEAHSDAIVDRTA